MKFLLLAATLSLCEALCENTCTWANDGYCDTPNLCSCGTDCADCGDQDENECSSSCGDGFRTCSDNSGTWCCDRSSTFNKCGDDFNTCKSTASKKTRKTVNGVLIGVLVTIFVAIAGGILACCFCCAGCPGYQSIHGRPQPIPQQQHIVIPPQQVAMVPTQTVYAAPGQEVSAPPAYKGGAV